MRCKLLFSALLFAALPAIASAIPASHATIRFEGAAAPTHEMQSGVSLALLSWTAGEHYAWSVNVTSSYAVVTIRANGTFNVTRSSQVVPSFLLPETEYPLFTQIARTDLTDVDGPVRVTNHTVENGTIVVRVGIPGPTNVTLRLDRDVTPPEFTLGSPTNLTPIGFYVESTTNELALGDLQIRRDGASEWIPNPTAVFHFRQRYPVQGLAANATHEFRYVFTDWAGNQNTSALQTVRTPPRPIVAPPVLVSASPANGSVAPRNATIEIVLSTPVGVIARGDVRVFVDLQEVTSNLTFAEGRVSYAPAAPWTSGSHRVGLEVRNSEGGLLVTQWRFSVADEKRTPLPAEAAVFGIIALFAIARRVR